MEPAAALKLGAVTVQEIGGLKAAETGLKGQNHCLHSLVPLPLSLQHLVVHFCYVLRSLATKPQQVLPKRALAAEATPAIPGILCAFAATTPASARVGSTADATILGAEQP